MDRLFTPIDELRTLEPEYFKRNEADIIAVERETPQKNPVMILEEGGKKIYRQAATYTHTTKGPPQNQEFIMQCKLRDLVGTGQAKTKKNAKQVASAELLKLLVRRHLEYGKELGIPCSSIQEADEYIDNALEQVLGAKADEVTGEALSDFDRDKNYVGLVQELLQKTGGSAIYEDEEEGTGTDTVFIVKCTVEKLVFEGRGKKKKEAKARAAYLMVKHLQESLSGLEKDFDDFSVDEQKQDAENVPLRPSTANPGKSLTDILNDKSKVANYNMEYTHTEAPNAFGLRRCLLTVKNTKAGETDLIEYTFYGMGSTREESEQKAALNALLLFETY